MADLIYEVKGHLARITMNRPEHLNCFSEEMIHLFTLSCFRETESPSVPAEM